MSAVSSQTKPLRTAGQYTERVAAMISNTAQARDSFFKVARMRNRFRASKRWFGFLVLLAALLSKSFAGGLDPGVKQLIVSVGADWDASTGKLQLFERSGEGWKPSAPPVAVLYGSKGLVWGRGVYGTDEPGTHKQEHDGRAPAGVFRIGKIYTYDNALPAGAKYPFRVRTRSSGRPGIRTSILRKRPSRYVVSGSHART